MNQQTKYIRQRIAGVNGIIIQSIMLSPREHLQQRRLTKGLSNALQEQWYDVQDEDGKWRVGYCEKQDQRYRTVLVDGFHPCHTALYCDHSGKILPIRTKTMGLTVPEGKTIRRMLTAKQIEQISGKLALYQLRSNQLQNAADSIRTVLRTELLIVIDKIFTTPVEVLSTIKMVDLHINKFFINVIEYYFKLLESSKKFFSMLQANETAKQLFNATFEMALMIQMILGVHPRSKTFYDSGMNRTVTCQGFLDCFIKSQAGILPFKLFLKNVTSMKNITLSDVTICLQTVSLFISMCEKYQKQFCEGKIQATTRFIIEEIINLIKFISEKSPENMKVIKEKVELISRIETMHFKLFPNKVCLLRKILDGDREKEKEKLISQLNTEKRNKNQQKERENEKLKELESKIQEMQTTISKLQTISLHSQDITVAKDESQQILQPTQNMGEEAFLASLQWALDAGDMQTCRKLVSWRKSLLKLGRIAGWQIALSVGMKTFKRKQITPDDIIQANYNFLIHQQGKKS